MNNYYVDASYGNKKFLTSVLSALEELRVDDFIQLYLKAQDPSAYRFKAEEGDVHTKLLVEIASHAGICPIEQERGAIILQAIYSAPFIANTTKAIAMLMVGATLEYDDFVSRFGSGGDLEPQAMDPKAFSQRNNFSTALAAGIKQSDDVRFLIDKVKVVDKLNEAHGLKQLPIIYRGGFNFDQTSFEQFIEAFPDNRNSIVECAPPGFYESDYFSELVGQGFVPGPVMLHEAFEELFNAERVDTFKQLLPHLMKTHSSFNIGRHSKLGNLFYSEPGEAMSDEKIEMQHAYKEAFYALTTAIINEREGRSKGNAHVSLFIRDTLVNALVADHLDDFSRVLKEATDAHPVRDGRDVFDDLYRYVSGYALNEIKNHGATKNLKAMVTLLKDTASGRMNQAVEQINQLPEVTGERRKKKDREARGYDAESHRDVSHEPRH
jgi:hypothetical protein